MRSPDSGIGEHDDEAVRLSEAELAQQAIQASEATLTAIFQNAPVAMLLLDRDRRVHRMNRAAEEVLGGSTDDVEGLAFGNAIRCVGALDDPGGCGSGPSCGQCLVRQTVNDTFDAGEDHRGVVDRVSETFGMEYLSRVRSLVK